MGFHHPHVICQIRLDVRNKMDSCCFCLGHDCPAGIALYEVDFFNKGNSAKIKKEGDACCDEHVMWICGNCEQTLKNEYIFCPNCGYSIIRF